jgi:quercetin dioxygenase-like cupin family protein
MTTQVAISNENIEESVVAGQPLSIPCGANHGFVNNGNQNAEMLCGITSAATMAQYFGEPIDVFDTEFGGELARF